MSEWKEYKLGEVIQSISETYKFKPNEKVVFLNTSDILNGKFLIDSLSEASTLPGQAKKKIQKGDILYSEIRPANKRFALVNFDSDNYVVSTKLMVLRCNGIVDNKFIYTYLTSNDVIEYLQMIAEDRSGTFPQITFDVIANMDIVVPPLPEQKRIAAILSSLDEKIDLLHRENKTLEAMAETLFKEYVLDKDNDATLEQIIFVQNGYAFKSKDFKEKGEHQIIKIKNISNGTIDIDTTDCVDNDVIVDVSTKFKVNSGDVLIAMTGAEIGKLGVIPKNEKSLWLNQRVGLLVEKYKGAKYLAYLQLKSEYGQDYIENTATGSAQPNISGIGIEKCGFPIFKQEDLIQISLQIGELYDKIIFNLGQINLLKDTRDFLLPKLMSNEIKLI